MPVWDEGQGSIVYIYFLYLFVFHSKTYFVNDAQISIGLFLGQCLGFTSSSSWDFIYQPVLWVQPKTYRSLIKLIKTVQLVLFLFDFDLENDRLSMQMQTITWLQLLMVGWILHQCKLDI